MEEKDVVLLVRPPNLSGSPSLAHLTNKDGISYQEFRKTLMIKQNTIFFNMLLPWFMIGLALLLFAGLREKIYWSGILTIPLAIWISFWMHAFTLHFHEAAHFNIHRNPKVNDVLAWILLTPFTGISINEYRASHWKHHLFLGTMGDTETSYAEPLSIKTILESLSGAYLIKIVNRYFHYFRKLDSTKSQTHSTQTFALTLSLMLSVQLIVMISLLCISPFAATAWVLNLFVFGPFIARIRQTLEHRPFDARNNFDSAQTNQAACNRIFGGDLFSRSFGAAGFNRHLLHHYEPRVSYTCFDEFEAFLLETELRETIESCRLNYWGTFRRLLRTERNGM